MFYEAPVPKIPILYQVDPNLISYINKFGCRFMCLLAIPQFFLKKTLSAEEIMYIYDEAIKMGPTVMQRNCTCGSEEHKIMALAFQLLGDKKHYCRQLFTSDYNSGAYASKDYLPSKNNPCFFIFDLRTSSSAEYGGKHFVLANDNGKLIYDPGHGTCDTSVKGFGRWLYYRIFSK